MTSARGDNQQAKSEQHPRETALDKNGLYNDIPAFVSLRKSSTSGRGLYVKEAITAGSSILVTRPHGHALSSINLSRFCSYCCEENRVGKDLQRCRDCKIIHYCNSTCQSADWKIHKSECQALRRLISIPLNPDNINTIPSDAVRTAARIIWQSKNEGKNSIWWREITAMYSDKTLHPSTVLASATNNSARFISEVEQYMGIAGPQDLAALGFANAGQLLDLTPKFLMNAFTLTAPDFSGIGVCMSPPAALINHSCEPNVVMVFPRSPSAATSQPEPILKVIALRDIPAGCELLVTYVDTTEPTIQRQQALQELYGFTCVCSLCSPKHANDRRSRDSGGSSQSKVKPPDWRISVFCPRKADGCMGRCLIPETEDEKTYCHICGTQLRDPKRVVEATRLGQEVFTKASNLEFSDVTEAFTNVLPYLTTAGLTPSTYPLFDINTLHQTILTPYLDYGSKEDLDNIIRLAARSVAGLSNILPFGHPSRAVALTELGRFLAANEPAPSSTSICITPPYPNTNVKFPPSGEARHRLALETLQRAHSEALIGFGREGSEIGRQVREMLVDVELELAIWRNGLRDKLRELERDPRF